MEGATGSSHTLRYDDGYENLLGAFPLDFCIYELFITSEMKAGRYRPHRYQFIALGWLINTSRPGRLDGNS